MPVADLSTLEGAAFDAIQTVARDLTHNFALRITLDELTRGDLRRRIHAVLLKLALKPQECVLILDFAKADMSNFEAVSDILLAEFHKVMEFGLWGQVVWHATRAIRTQPGDTRANCSATPERVAIVEPCNQT